MWRDGEVSSDLKFYISIKLDRFVNSKFCGKRRLIVIFPLPSFRAGIR